MSSSTSFAVGAVWIACATGCNAGTPVRAPTGTAAAEAAPAHVTPAAPVVATPDPWAPPGPEASKVTAAPAAPAPEAPADTGSDTPGVTATEIKIGQTMPYSGPASAYGAIGRGEAAYFRMINDTGGVNGHKIALVSLDDGYMPARTIEQTRKLVEREGVAFLFGSVGTASNTAVWKYLNDRKVPQLFVASGADKWADPEHYPWTMGWQPSYRIEARVYGKYLRTHKNAKVCVIYQNDDFGKDYVTGLKEGLTPTPYGKMVVKEASYEVTDPTVYSQIDQLRVSGCNTLVVAATPKFAAQTIRHVFDIGWKPVFFLSNVSVSISIVLRPAGLNKAAGIITSAFIKDPAKPAHAHDRGIAQWHAFMTRYVPDADQSDLNYVYAYAVAQTLVQVLQQCGNDLSRENIMRQAASLRHFKPSVVLDGIEVNTSPTDFHPIGQLQLARFNGTAFEPLGKVVDGE